MGSLIQVDFAARILAGGLAVAAGHGILTGVSLWALDTPRLALWFGLTGVFTAALAVLAFRLIRRPGGEGGGGTGPAPEPGEPPWWPGFEREFRAQAERQAAGDPASSATPVLMVARSPQGSPAGSDDLLVASRSDPHGIRHSRLS